MTEGSEGKGNCKTTDRLNELRDSLRENLLKAQNTLNTTESDISASEKQITAIEALISKREQIIADYAKAHPGLKAKYDEFKAIYCNEIKSFENSLGKDGMENVKKIVNQARGHVEILGKLQTDLRKFNRCLNGEVTNGGKRNELDKTKQKLERAKKIYDYWIDPVKSIESRFKSLERIKKEVDKEQSAENYKYAYYLLELAKEDSFKYYLEDFLFVPEIPAIPAIPKNQDTCDDPGALAVPATNYECAPIDIIPPSKINQRLVDVWIDYQEADKAFQKTTGAVKALEKLIETRQKQLTEDKKNLEATIERLLNSEIEEGGGSSGGTPNSSGKKQNENMPPSDTAQRQLENQSAVRNQ